MRLVFWGTYDLSKPRTRILQTGLLENGVDVVEIHANIWPEHADKSQLRIWAIGLALLRALIIYPVLIWRYLRTPAHDVVVVPYLGLLDVLILWPFAKLRGRPIVWDMFLSLYDTVVNDRKMVSPKSPVAWALKLAEKLGCHAADRVLLDTKAHATYIAGLFNLADGKTGAVPVGAEPGAFSRQAPPAPHDGPTKVLFYGQLIPLHGITTILQAAMSERGAAHQWRVIGTGQDRELVENALAGLNGDHIIWDDWVPYETLIDAITRADICLGIFGPSDKAASVVPNKVYQSLCAGRSVITRQSPAMNETFPDLDAGLQLVPHSDPTALLDAIDVLKAANYPVMPMDKLTLAQPMDIAMVACEEVFKPLIKSH